ncbi:MAG: tRNA lysidine(34) synthetase TilS, partial [Bacteroidia bacterium]|nr:tRNA lysidine(34) synthetase TilS [Bacteroidia bacterium]
MKEEFKKYLFENCIKNDEKRILLAVSGGVDSMLMLHLFSGLEDIRISVAHCNYQLRGMESKLDELLVKETCNKLGFTFHHQSFNTNQYAKNNHLSVQMAARELRYNWFNELIKEYNYDLIATAHHKNDVVETM